MVCIKSQNKVPTSHNQFLDCFFYISSFDLKIHTGIGSGQDIRKSQNPADIGGHNPNQDQ